jgi:DNA polymerase-4
VKTPVLFHVDIDAFLASVEQIVHPELRGKPVAVGDGVVASCSYEARVRGVRAAMRLSEARRRCPELVVRKGHAQVARRYVEEVLRVCGGFSPRVERVSLDEVYCDFTGLDRHYGFARRARAARRRRPSGPRIAEAAAVHDPRPAAAAAEASLWPLEAADALRAAIRTRTWLSVTIGVGTNRVAARTAARWAKPGGIGYLLPGREARAMRDLPLQDLPGAGPAVRAELEDLRVETAGDLRALGRPVLEALFGANGAVLHERAWGRDARSVEPDRIPRSISRESSFEEPTEDPDHVEGTLHYLTERAARELRRRRLAARTVGVRIRYADSVGAERRATLPAPASLDPELFRAARDLYRALHVRRSRLHLVGVALTNLVPSGDRQGDLFLDARRDPAALYRGVDRIRERWGFSALVAGPSVLLLGDLRQDEHGFVLRTPSLTL